MRINELLPRHHLDRPTGGPLGDLSERALAGIVFGLSFGICVAILLLIAFPQALRVEGLDISLLPTVHATLNATTAVLLVVGYLLIRAGKVGWHRAAMVGAFSLSTLFLVSYVVYHSQAPVTAFGGEGWIRPVYFFTLISHVLLAPVVLPLALYAVLRALRGEFERHRRVVRWTFPIWLYVAVTGVLVYLMMAPYYPTS